jgi:PAS domain S-box-containing protein
MPSPDPQVPSPALVELIPAIVYRRDVGEPARQTVHMGPRMIRRLGITPAAMEADPDLWRRLVHPDDAEAVAAEIERCRIGGGPFAMEYRMVAVDGSAVWVRDEAEPAVGEDGTIHAWQGVMLDITARKAAEAQLAEAEERYRALVEQSPAIVYIDPVEAGPSIYISPQVEAVLGYAPHEWYEDPDLWSKVVHPDDRDAVRVEATGEAQTTSTYRMIAKDGRIVWVTDRSTLLLDDDGTPRYWQGVLIDVTEQRHHAELEAQLERERLEAERLRAEDEMKTTFLQAVSHDLRTPLAAILGLAVTLEREDLRLPTAETRDMARRIATNARKLDAIVGDFLDLERLNRGVAVPELTPVDLGALIHELVATTDLVAGRHLDVDVEAPLVVAADRAMVERIVENLLGNAAKHTPADARVWVRLERTEEGAVLIVEDDGRGVALEDRLRIFEPFRQAAGSGGGSGVGLALVARFAALHGGRAWVQDRPSGGASFRVLLAWSPPAPPVDPGVPAHRGEPADPGPPGTDDQTATGSSAESQA